jgi:hypothetical protein
MKYFIIIILFTFSFLSYSQDTITFNANFNTDEYVLNKEQIKSITDILKKLEGDLIDYKFEIQGHTDSIGNWDYNLQLSGKRCHSLENEILKLGISTSQIKIKPNSFNSPIDKNSTLNGRANNRRAQLNIIYTPEKPNWSITEQSHFIDPLIQNVITTINGCDIIIPANSTINSKGLEKIEYRITEFNNPAEFIAYGIPMSYKQQSGFYIYHSEELFSIYALNGKDTLKLNPEKKIEIKCKDIDTSKATAFYKFNQKNEGWVDTKVINIPILKKETEPKENKEADVKTPIVINKTKVPEKKPDVVAIEINKDKTPKKGKAIEYTIDTIKGWLNVTPINIDTISPPYEPYSKEKDWTLLSCVEYWNKIINFAMLYTNKEFNPYTDTTAEYVDKNYLKKFPYSEYFDNFLYARTKYVDTTDMSTKNNKDYYSLKLNFKKHLLKKYSTIEFKQLKKENKFFNDFENYEWKYFNKNNQIALTKLSKKRFSDFKIDYNLNENTVSLDLKGRNEFYKIILVPKINNNEKNILSEKVNHFKDSLIQAEKLFYIIKAKQKTADSLRFKNGLRIDFNYNYFTLWDFWRYSYCAQEENEKSLSYNNWIKYFNQNRNKIRAKYINIKENTGDFYSKCCKMRPKEIISGNGDPKFLILNFGLYNFDKVIPLNSLITLNDYSFLTEKGNSLKIKNIFLVLKGINGMVNFSNETGLFLVKGFHNTLIVFTTDNRCYKYSYNLIKQDFSVQKSLIFKDISKKILTKKGFENEMNVNK